jgi:hypothetical protein
MKYCQQISCKLSIKTRKISLEKSLQYSETQPQRVCVPIFRKVATEKDITACVCTTITRLHDFCRVICVQIYPKPACSLPFQVRAEHHLALKYIFFISASGVFAAHREQKAEVCVVDPKQLKSSLPACLRTYM